LSSDLTHDEDILSGYLNFSSASTKSFTYKIGLRAEYSTSFFKIIENPEEIYSTKLFIAPSILLKQNLSNQSSLAFSFTRRITRPTYPQINPYVNMIDKTVFETGNKNLKPEEVSKFEIAYNLGNNGHSLMTSLYLSSATDFITQISSLYDQNSLMLTYVNGEKSIKSGIEINGRYKFSPLFVNKIFSKIPGWFIGVPSIFALILQAVA
jgi:outer membrane receptor protein involved in Fe transport